MVINIRDVLMEGAARTGIKKKQGPVGIDKSEKVLVN
jgi:hypothetical protein